MKSVRSLACLLLLPPALLAAPAGSWNFENGSAGWQLPGPDSGVVVEPGCPTNHAFQIVATKPHHTQLVLPQSEATSDFIASVRFRIVASEGFIYFIFLIQ